jgi:uncharacterized membrane protein
MRMEVLMIIFKLIKTIIKLAFSIFMIWVCIFGIKFLMNNMSKTYRSHIESVKECNEEVNDKSLEDLNINDLYDNAKRSLGIED